MRYMDATLKAAITPGEFLKAVPGKTQLPGDEIVGTKSK